MYKLEFYVPASHIEVVKKAIFAAGAGMVGNYSQCAWQTQGIGQFFPNALANPFIGLANVLEKVDEFKVETVVQESKIISVIEALKTAHPYEEPAYNVSQILDF